MRVGYADASSTNTPRRRSEHPLQKPVAAYGKGDKGAELALMMKHWIADVWLVWMSWLAPTALRSGGSGAQA
jgi:hypothetical protein